MKNASEKYAVIFISTLKPNSVGYDEMSIQMETLLENEEGFLGMDSTRNENTRVGITVCYWKDLESIKNWKKNEAHKVAQENRKSSIVNNDGRFSFVIDLACGFKVKQDSKLVAHRKSSIAH